MFRMLLTAVFSISVANAASTTYFDCANYCAFSEFPNNCHGIAFKSQKNGEKPGFTYSVWSESKNGCISPEFLTTSFVSEQDILAQCKCPENPAILPDRNEPIHPETIAELKVLRDQARAFAPCGPDPLLLPEPKDGKPPYAPRDVASCQQMKAQGRQGYVVMGDCLKEGSDDCSYFGNTNYYAGPFCFAGDLDRCHDVLTAQDPDSGAWYRNAYDRRFVVADHGQPTFSRDEFLGIMLYMLKTKDKVAAEKWMRFVASNPKKRLLGKLYKVFNICPPLPAQKPDYISDKDWAKMQPDDRCEMRPDSWAAMYRVYRALGFTKSELKAISPKMYRIMISSFLTSGITAAASARLVGPYSYEQGDQATNILILRAAGMSRNVLLDDAANTMDRRNGFESPYFHYLAKGNQPSEYGAYLIKKYCPRALPDYSHPPQGGIGTPGASYFEFGVHWFGGLYNGWQAILGNGHECIAWINFYLGDS